MNGKMFPPLIGDKVTVYVPDGFPELMMKVSMEVLRNPPGDEEHEILSFIADYLERLLEERRRESEDLMDMVTNLTKTDGEKYLDGLKQIKRCTDEQLDELAITIQRKWKKYKGYDCGDFIAKDICTDGIIKPLLSEDTSFNIANKGATVIQKSWRKCKPSNLSKYFKTEDMEELDFECDYDDDMERVNVVKKGQRYYVPPIPNFTNDSFESPSVTDVFENFMEITEDEETND